jgi:hypothetical protein
MGKKLNLMGVPCGHSFAGWLSNQSFKIVVALSLLHIGLAYIHAQRSGRADYYFPF